MNQRRDIESGAPDAGRVVRLVDDVVEDERRELGGVRRQRLQLLGRQVREGAVGGREDCPGAGCNYRNRPLRNGGVVRQKRVDPPEPGRSDRPPALPAAGRGRGRSLLGLAPKTSYSTCKKQLTSLIRQG